FKAGINHGSSCKLTTKKMGGSRLHPRNVHDLIESMEKCEIDDLKAVGSFYTWTNRSEGDGRILCIVEEVWDCNVLGNPMIRLYSKLKLLKGKLIEWNKKNFSDLQGQVIEARENLVKIHEIIQMHPMDTQLATLGNIALKKYIKLAAAEESSLKQKAGASWALLGDENKSFFYKKVQGRRARNSVCNLEVDNNNVIDKKEISHAFVSHYQQVLGQATTAVYRSNLVNFVNFDHPVPVEMQQSMSAEITEVEIKAATGR
ncbi:Ribonuclease h domain, partial [Thalictrum thalictroides]